MLAPAARIGERIREARERRNLTQAALGKKLGITYQAVQRYEHDRAQPSPDRLAIIAEILDADWRWLITGEEVVR
jgi:transcriptional regulator with XRE-family HTH domain